MDPHTYASIKRTIRTLLDIDLDAYKDEQMRRRLTAWLVRSGATSWHDYFKRVRESPEELAKLRNYLTINVSAFLRDPERWQDLRTRVLPELLKAAPRLRVWSAGCSIGLEAYTLAVMLEELTPARRHTLLASDLDRGALTIARNRGPFSDQDLKHMTPDQRQRYLDPGGPPHFFNAHLARAITFREHNMLTEPFEPNLDLIVCRNVVIYFTDVAKAELYRKFHAALRPGGYLFVGGTEIVLQAQAIGFETHGISFYRRKAGT